MRRLPDRARLDHLKKQAKEFLRDYRAGRAEAFARLRDALPAARGRDDAALVALDLRLHDVQSCIAREYGFASWNDLTRYVDVRSAARRDPAAQLLLWLELVYGGEPFGRMLRPNPRVALRVLHEHPALLGADPYLACAVGETDVLRRAIGDDRAWVNGIGGPLRMPPLVAVTHSSLLQVPEYRERLHRSVRLLLDGGADPNQRFTTPAGHTLSALYGAVGKQHDSVLATMLLDAGANPDDGESLYHSLDDPACTRALLEHGATAHGSNAIYRALDLADPEPLRLLLAFGADPNEPARNAPITQWGSPLLWAIKRGRSRDHVEALLDAGADPTKRTPAGTSAYGLAAQFGLDDVAALLRERSGAAAAEILTEEERFVAACARGDVTEAQRIRAARPDLPAALTEQQLRILPELAAAGHDRAVRTMVELGWPIEARGGDWEASALNMAVFRGDAALARFLLEHGAQWTATHGFGDNVLGTLSWSSRMQPSGSGDWVACARLLREFGVPIGHRDPDEQDAVIVAGRSRPFSDEVYDVLLGGS